MQRRRCNALLRSEASKLDGEIAHMKRQEIEDKSLVMEADKRDERVLAQELIHCRKILRRLMTAKWELTTLQDEVNRVFRGDNIEKKCFVSFELEYHLKSLLRLPELADAMAELVEELREAGIIEEEIHSEHTTDRWPVFIEDDVFGDEVDRVMEEIRRDRLMATITAPGSVVANSPQ